MLDILFNPNRQHTPSQFNLGAIVLIVIGALLSLVPMLGLPQGVTTLIGLLSYVTIYTWVVLFMGRYRDAGESPVKCLIPIAVYVAILVVAMIVVLWGDFMQAMAPILEAAREGLDPSAVEAEAEVRLMELLPAKAPQLAAVGAIVSALVAFGFNRLIGPSKHRGKTTDETFG